MKTEIRKCEHCGMETECEETRRGIWVCSYACLEGFYANEIPEDEDFKGVAQ